MRSYLAILLSLYLIFGFICGAADAKKSGEKLKVWITSVNTSNFSPVIDVSDEHENKLNLIYAANDKVSWKIQIYDKKNKLVRQWQPKWAQTSWDGRNDKKEIVPSGKYLCKVIALDDKGGRAEGAVSVTVDRDKPGFILKPKAMPQVITNKNQSPSIIFSPNEPVSAFVFAMDATGKRRVYVGSGLASLDLKKGEKFEVGWGSVDGMPNGGFNFQIVMTDDAGNYVEYNIPFTIKIPNNTNPEIDYDQSFP